MRRKTSFNRLFALVAFQSMVYLLPSNNLLAQNNGNYTPSAGNLAYRQTFRDMKFGLFVHWGIYSLLGDGEWVMHNRNIPYSQYNQIANGFYPHAFDAQAWVAMAKAAGMKYITITSRHHDGFSMFHTKASPYNVMDATPFKRDVIGELAKACAAGGIKLHLYYSLLDWGRLDYGFRKPIVNGAPADTEWNSYLRFMQQQLTELLTQYGDVVQAVWFDGDWERPTANWEYDKLYALIHQLRPDVLIGNNHHTEVKPGEDFQLFEKDLPGSNSHGFGTGSVSNSLPLETCETMNNHWGYHILDQNFKTVRTLIHYLAKAASHDANFLLNVGPKADGTIPQPCVDTLLAMGKWLQVYGSSIYGTRGQIIPEQPWGCVTRKDKVLYVHVLSKPDEPYVFLPGIQVSAAQVFGKKEALRINRTAEGTFIYHNYPDDQPVDHILQATL